MNADEKVDKLFDAARNARPEMDLELLEQKIELIGNRTPKFKIYFNPKLIIAMSLIAVISTVLVLFFNKPVSELNPDFIAKSEPIIAPQINAKSGVQVEKETPIKQKEENRITKENRKSLAPIFAFEHKLPLDAMPFNNFSKEVEKPILPADTNLLLRRINITSIKVVELTNEELLNLGISVEDKRIKVPIYKSNICSYYFKEGTDVVFKMDHMELNWPSPIINPQEITPDRINFNSEISASINLKLEDKGDSTPRFYKGNSFPYYSLITDDLGQKWRLFEVDDGLTEEDKKYMRANNLNEQTWDKAIKGKKEGEKKLIEKIPSLVPVLVRSGDVNIPGDTQNYRADIIIWFEPSEELFNALPKRISDDLRKEYQSVFVTKKSDAKTCTYFEACQNTPGAINYFSAFPNPTDAELNVEFNLADARILEANIYSINGMLLKKVLSSKSYEMGKHKFETNIGDLLPGVYVLVIESDKGDVISRRIVRR
jgi:hypothetical protein